MKYAICQEIISQESAENGESESQDYWEDDSLSSALDSLFSTRTAECGGIESLSASYHNGRLCILVNNGMEYRTGDYESRSLHVHGITMSSAKRICRSANVPLNF